MTRLTGARGYLALGIVTSLVGCAQRPPVVSHTPPTEVVPPRPELPAYLGAIVPPALGGDGYYQTINHGIDAQQTMWHVRAALNVAAIGCRSADGTSTIAPAYNQMLTSQRGALAAANKSVQQQFRARFGAAAWQGAHDAYMTRLYNFFAAPAAKPSFCAAAAPLAAQAAALPVAQFAAFAATALPQLEAPFTDVFRQVDTYRTALTAWTSRYGSGAIPATATPIEAATRAPASTATRPHLAYADMGMLLTWQSPRGIALAAN